MVLQQKTEAAVWGWAEPGEEVTVSLGDAKADAKAGDDGKWSLKLATPAAGGPVRTEGQRQERNHAQRRATSARSGSAPASRTWNGRSRRRPIPTRRSGTAKHPKIRMIKVARNPSDKPRRRHAPNRDSGRAACSQTRRQFLGRRLLLCPASCSQSSTCRSASSAPTGAARSAKPGPASETLGSRSGLFGPSCSGAQNFKPGNPNQASVLLQRHDQAARSLRASGRDLVSRRVERRPGRAVRASSSPR